MTSTATITHQPLRPPKPRTDRDQSPEDANRRRDDSPLRESKEESKEESQGMCVHLCYRHIDRIR